MAWYNENLITGNNLGEGFLGFKQGGTVPGKRGKPVKVIAHGGERILPAKNKGPVLPKCGIFKHMRDMGKEK